MKKSLDRETYDKLREDKGRNNRQTRGNHRVEFET